MHLARMLSPLSRPALHRSTSLLREIVRRLLGKGEGEEGGEARRCIVGVVAVVKAVAQLQMLHEIRTLVAGVAPVREGSGAGGWPQELGKEKDSITFCREAGGKEGAKSG